MNDESSLDERFFVIADFLGSVLDVFKDSIELRLDHNDVIHVKAADGVVSRVKISTPFNITYL
jgi:hypothetical protein